MCLNVEANGWGESRNSHVSVYLYMMRGEYDESLKWPFRGDITVQLLNQVGDDGHHADVIRVTDCVQDKFGMRVVYGDRSLGEWGLHSFICHSSLLPNYLKLCIKEVKLKC